MCNKQHLPANDSLAQQSCCLPERTLLSAIYTLRLSPLATTLQQTKLAAGQIATVMCIPSTTVACVETSKPLILSKVAMQLSASGATSLLLGLQPIRKVPCAAGADWSIFNPPASWRRREVAQLYGDNDMQTGRPISSRWLAPCSSILSMLSRSASSMCPSHSALKHPYSPCLCYGYKSHPSAFPCVPCL